VAIHKQNTKTNEISGKDLLTNAQIKTKRKNKLSFNIITKLVAEEKLGFI
jgi:hypothetical protein